MPGKTAPRLGEFDIRERLAPQAPAWLVQIVFAFVCIAAEIVTRLLLSQFLPGGAAPFALIYPAVLAAVLFAGWLSGAIVLVVSEILVWYFVLPEQRTFVLSDPADGPRLVIILIAGLLVIFLANAFRETSRAAVRVRNAQLADRDLLLREIEHRTKNNFAMVSGLIDIQRRRSQSEDVKAALTGVMARMENFSRAHSHLRLAPGDASVVNMKIYIGELSEALAQALTLQGAVTLSALSDDAAMDRDRAVTIGLLINELVTNAAKHAFIGRDRGTIEIEFRRIADGWRLVVADNGIGIDPEKAERAKDGLGQRLVEAFALQANGTLSTESDANGARITIDFKS